jgi:carbon storage regulator
MLVLTRKSNQSIMIGDEIEVSVLSVMGEKVRIGIQAPQRVPVFRKEIYLEIHREAGAGEPSQDGDSAAADHSPGVGKSLRELGDAT